MPIEFAEMLARLGADDTDLQRDLKAAETAVKRSGERMQKSLDTVSVGAGKAGAALGTLARSASALGGSMGGAIGQGVAFGETLAGLGLKLSTGVLGLAALAAAVVVYRKEISEAAIKTAEWAGWIEDVTNKQLRLDTVAKDLAFRLEQQRAQQGIRDEAALTKERLGVATSGGAAALAELDLLQQVEKQFRALPGDLQRPSNRALIEQTLRDRQAIVAELEKEKQAIADLAEAKSREAQAEKEAAAKEKERLQEAINLQEQRRSAAQSALVAIGAAKGSEFIDDPIIRQIARLSETARDKLQEETPTSGTFGLRKVVGSMSIIRAGEIIGRQQLTIAERTAQTSVDQLNETRQIREILNQINRRSQSGAMSGVGGLVVTGNP